MSVTFRIIPRLDIKGHNLVKGMYLKGIRVLSDLKKYFQDNKKNTKTTIVAVGLEKLSNVLRKVRLRFFYKQLNEAEDKI